MYGTPTIFEGCVNPSGWMNNELFPQVLRHFTSHFSGATEKPKLLDNYASHASFETITIAKIITKLSLPSLLIVAIN